MAGVITDNQSVPANGTVVNVYTGQLDEFLQDDSIVQLGIVGAASGLFYTLIVGKEVIVQDQEMSDANRFPQDPEDFVIQAAGLQGDRLVLSLRNSTAGALVVRSITKINAVN